MPRHGKSTKQPGQKKRYLYALANGKCQKCGCQMSIKGDKHAKNKPNTATLQHMTPRAHGGSDDMENLQVWCHQCNMQDGQEISNRINAHGR